MAPSSLFVSVCAAHSHSEPAVSTTASGSSTDSRENVSASESRTSHYGNRNKCSVTGAAGGGRSALGAQLCRWQCAPVVLCAVITILLVLSSQNHGDWSRVTNNKIVAAASLDAASGSACIPSGLPTNDTTGMPPCPSASNRTFIIDNNAFVRDGEPVQIISASIHYFRVHPQYWQDRLLRLKALGVNAIDTYVAWNMHETERGRFDFTRGTLADVEGFLRIANDVGLMVLLRIGPYICAEWDLGGFPPWLLTIKPPLSLRSSDPNYLNLVDAWWAELLPRMVPLLWQNGGPVVMVQVENEYGWFGSDKVYLIHLVRLARKHLGNSILLYTTDHASMEAVRDGTLPGGQVFSAVDFFSNKQSFADAFDIQRAFNTPGQSPLMTSEFYTSWFTAWGGHVPSDDSLRLSTIIYGILASGASINLYMGHGGTSFGFHSGANIMKDGTYQSLTTSYDYLAPVAEDGSTDSPLFHAIREVFAKYQPHPLPAPPELPPHDAFGTFQADAYLPLLDWATQSLSAVQQGVDLHLPSMEELSSDAAFALYSTTLSQEYPDSSTLGIADVHDRAYVYLTKPTAPLPFSPLTSDDPDCQRNNSGGSTLMWQRLRGQTGVSCSTHESATQATGATQNVPTATSTASQWGNRGTEAYDGSGSGRVTDAEGGSGSSGEGGYDATAASSSHGQPTGGVRHQEHPSLYCRCAMEGTATQGELGNTTVARASIENNGSLPCDAACANGTAVAVDGAAMGSVGMEVELLDAVQSGRARVAVVERSPGTGEPIKGLRMKKGDTLEILVESMGRVHFGPFIYDKKGLLGNVTIGSTAVTNWSTRGIVFPDNMSDLPFKSLTYRDFNSHGLPTLYRFPLNLSIPADTFLDVTGWTRGVAWINGFNLGRYWPELGPYCTLYLPAPLLRPGSNTLVLLELLQARRDLKVSFVKAHDTSCPNNS